MRSRDRLLSILLIVAMVISLSGRMVPGGGSVFMSRAHASQEISSESAETEALETEAVETESVSTEAAGAEALETGAVETDPVSTESTEAESVETESVSTESAEAGAVESEPAEKEDLSTFSAVQTEVLEDPEAEGAGEKASSGKADGLVVPDSFEEAGDIEDGRASMDADGGASNDASGGSSSTNEDGDKDSGKKSDQAADSIPAEEIAADPIETDQAEEGRSEDTAGRQEDQIPADSVDAGSVGEGLAADTLEDAAGLEEQVLAARVDWGILYDDAGFYYESTERVNPVSQDLLGRIPETVWDHDADYRPGKKEVTVTVTGVFPQGVTAVASCIPFEEDKKYAERALMALDLLLYDADGNLFLPQGEFTVTLGGSRLKKVFKKGQPILVYQYEENTVRSRKTGSYAADVTVYRDLSVEDPALLYTDRDGNGAIRYFENLYGLTLYTDNTADLYADTLPLHFLITAQDDSVLQAAEDDSRQAEEEDRAQTDGPQETEEAEEAGRTQGEADGQEEKETDRADGEAGGQEGKEADRPKKEAGEDPAGQTDTASDTDRTANGAAEEATSKETPSAAEEITSEKALGATLTQTLRAGDGKEYSVTVTYDDESGIPSDARLYVSEIKEGDAGYDEYVAQSADALGVTQEDLAFARAFDITLKNPRTGEEYQPDGTVQVSIELLKDDLNSYASVDVVHVPDGAGEEARVMDTTLNGETVEFETDGFSVYVLVGSGGETAARQCTYTFWIPNEDVPGTYKEYSFKDSEGRTVYSQTVISGEELIVPQMTSIGGKTFTGWYKGDTTGGTLTLEEDPYDFDNITITENSAIDLYAVYTTYATVFIHDQFDSESNSFPVAYTRRAELVTTGEGSGAAASAVVKIDDLRIANTSVGDRAMAFFGWSETPITTPGAAEDDEGNPVTAVTMDAEGCISVSGETHLYPIFIETHLLTFYAAATGEGAVYNGPRYLNKGESLGALPTTSMRGKTFTGWFTGTLNGSIVDYGRQISNADGSLIVGADDAGVYVSDGRLYLRADTTLYAGWTDDTSAEYRILYWQQNGTGTEYSYKESVSHTGRVGETVSVSDTDKADDRYDGYHLKEEPASAEVKADGSTVLNVYYDYNDGYVPAEGTYTLTFADSVTEEGKTSADLPKTEQVAYGSGISAVEIPAPSSGRKGYVFSKWFLDPYGIKEAHLNTMNMPDHDLTLYAGWELEWYVVSIDPNYGELNPLNEQGVPTGTGSTWFWQTIEREPVAEYTHVERNYVASSSGNYYYVYHPGDGEGGTVWPDRYTYYTTDISKATEDTTFEYAPGTYTYVGWYEVLEDGTEVPYVFGERTDHNTNLKLHWKKNGVYYLKYNAVVDGLSGTMDDADESAELFEDGIFADYAEITLTHSATAPNGSTFIGWKVRNSDRSVIYTPGQVYTLHAEDAKRVSGKDVVYLDAVYARVGTASIMYHANGGTVAGDSVDFGMVPGTTADGWNHASGTVDTAAGTAIVSGLANNSKFKLSDGSGFLAPAGSNAVFLGWSDQAVCDDSATFYSKDSNDTYGVSESNDLFAVWGAQVTYHLNSTDADWGDEAWDSTVYTLDSESGSYSQTANLGTVVSEPAKVPVYTGTDGRLFRYWATRTATGDELDPYSYTEYDFSQKITGGLDLYACWGEADTITVHAVDASEADPEDKTNDPAWTVRDVTVSAAEMALNGTSHVTMTPDNYEFAFAAIASDMDSLSERNAVTAIKYENKKIKVRYAGESAFRVLGEDRELFFVYYQKKALDIGLKSMAASGVLEDVTASEAPAAMNVLLGEYSMSSQLTAPLDLAAGFTNYAFAIGSKDPGGETQMNASNLNLITNAAGSGDPVPTLRVRNTWRGFEYTTETGENAVWSGCGYEPRLYVIFYTQQPTVVMFSEKTVGTSAVMDTGFTYHLLITQTPTTTVSVQTQVKNEGGEWENSGDPDVTTISGEPETVFDTTDSDSQPYILKNGEAASSILFYSETTDKAEGEDDGTGTRTVTTTTRVTAQTAVIMQTLQEAFTTSINVDGNAYTDSRNVYTYTVSGNGGTRDVTFVNTHKSLPVELHVAIAEGDGAAGRIVQRDSEFRNTAETAYKLELALGESVKLLEKLPAAAYETTEGEGDEAHQVSHEGLFIGDSHSYAFGSVAWGTGTEGNPVTISNMGAVSVAYEQIEDNVYELVLMDSEGNTISELGSDQLYYLYFPMPEIRYVKEAADGTLTDITGCLMNQTTGSIEPDESVTYGHQTLTMNGETVTQNQSLEIPSSGLVISQKGNHFRMPPVLDDGLYERYLGYAKIGAGSGDATNSSELDVSTGLTMQLKIQNNTLQYSFDGTAWEDLPLSGTPTVYAIYSERGYDFQISKTVDMSQSGENALFSGAGFTVTIRSTGITKNRYDVEGADSSTVAAEPAEGTAPGTITLPVADGSKIRIKGLGRGDYTITESGNENYILTARTGSIIGSSTSPMTVNDNTLVSFTLDSEKKVDLTNSPKAICRIDNHYFYTLRSMVDYVEENIATKTATAEMLTDYLMPLADTVEIPGDFNLTLITADSVGRVAVITRTDDLAAVPLFTNSGTLTLTNLTLEGSSMEATAPVIRSAGDLTIGSGATIQNAINTGSGENAVYGGAIHATAGTITVGGVIQNCSSAEGGAIYHSGNSRITLNGTGTIQNNTAASGSGGAIWLAGGVVKVSGTSRITGNKAESGSGGAIFVNSNVEIEIDQGGAVTGNTAKEGGAIYANSAAAIAISETENVTVKPAVTGNTATSGNGGAIYVNGGSVSVSGGSVSNNTAEDGQGGAIFGSSASVTVSGTAEVSSNTAKEGGAVYTVSGQVSVSGGTIEDNTASTGSGGAVYADSGNVTVSGGSLSGNRSTKSSGGAVYAGSGNVAVSGGSLSDNTAQTDGGAVFAGNGSITLSAADGGTAATIRNNAAVSGRGGALYANTGAVSVTGTALTRNTAGSDGGAVYGGSGAVTLTDSTFGGDAEADGNTAGGSGGAVYAGSGNVTVSGGSLKNNRSTGGSGGAIYAGSGTVTVSSYIDSAATSYTQFVRNSAAAGNGGAVCVDSGSLTLTSVTATENSAVNGAAVFTNNGRATFDGGSYTGSTASGGGAVGVGGSDARLIFNGSVQVRDNTQGTGDSAVTCNVYLDQDDDAVINIDTLTSNAAIGIYVADGVENTRGVPGARFAVYTSNSNAAKITNDRYTSLTVQSDTAAKKFYWGSGVRIEVMYRAGNAGGLPNGTSSGRGSTVKDIGIYFPTLNSTGEVALSELAADVYTRYSDVSNGLRTHPNAAFGGAFYYDAPDYGYDISSLIWNTTEEKWQVVMRSGQTDELGNRRIYVIYSEPAYISIENNTDETLNITDLQMTVNGSDLSVINSSTSAGYGMVFAKNGAIRTALLPITAADLALTAGQSVSLLIPGGQNMGYKLDGEFETTTGGSVRFRRGAESSLSEETVTVSAPDGSFGQLTGTTLNTSGTYNIIFGTNKIICKVVDAGGTEHPYSKISDAIRDIIAAAEADPPYALAAPKTAAIEMVTDYLLTASDDVNIPQGFDITLTTAAKEGAVYCYSGTGDRAILSRDTQNTDSMIKAWNALAGNQVVTTLRLKDLIIDGKSVRGSSDGGAVATQYTNVYIDTVDFKNVYASNGGALLVMFNFNKTNPSAKMNTVAQTILEVKNSDFTGCTSTTTATSNRLGGGAIVTNAETMTLEGCDFTNCTAVDQAGAVFHRIDYDNNSWTNVTGCTFTNCSANAAGGLEIDSKTITVSDSVFEHCVATQRNGGGFNVYALNAATPTADCWVTVSGCTFNDCQLTTTNTSNGNGGGFRCNAVYTKVENCTFTNNQALYGGGFCVSNGNAKKAEVYGCTFERNTASQGGGIFGKPKELIIGDYTYTDDHGVEQTRHTEIKNCTSKNEGGGIYHDKNADGSSLTVTNAVISGNRTTNSGKNGGGIYTNCREVTVNGSTIIDNTCTSQGGGLYAYSYKSLTITDSDISRNIASGNGGGVWFDADNDTNRARQVLTIKGCSIDGNTSNANGGGVFTVAGTVRISASETKTDSDGRAVRSSISNNTAKTNGGGIHQSKNMDGNSLTIADTNIDGNTANNTNTGTDQGGGGIYAGVRTLSITNSSISNNTAISNGGGILFDINNNDARNAMRLTVEGCTLNGNTSGAHGGGICTKAKTVAIGAYTEGEGESADMTRSVISNCTAAWSGGGIYQNTSTAGANLTVADSTISGCISNDTNTDENSNPRGGGGIYAYVETVTITGSAINNNSAVRQGGGIDMPWNNGSTNKLVIDSSTIKGNNAGYRGGGVFSQADLTLRNNTEITDNRLGSNTVANCAGVYLINNRTLYVGPEDASEGQSDTIIVRNNTTANGTLSDLRLWDNGSENNAQSVYVYCNLSNESEIRVVNAAKAGTQFGSAAYALTNGFSDDNAVFKADSSTLYGITDRTDSTNKKIIWAGPPIAKLTDGDGRLLFIKYYAGIATYPAIFDRLDTGSNTEGSTVSPFSILRMDGLTLYYKDGTTYTGTDYCIKMLVERYETTADMMLPYQEGRRVTFTTADTTVTEEDPYRFEGRSGGRATVIRDSSVPGGRPLMNVQGTLNLENIIIDGGTENGVAATANTRCIYINHADCTVTLGENAVLQNGKVTGSNNGGGVCINDGQFIIEGGVIRNCEANDGGGVYLNNGSLTLTAGSIYQCTARASGGGVRARNGSFTMSGGSIQGCSAKDGGGVYLPGNQNYPMYMSGGSIINNSASASGGGIAFYDKRSRLYLSGKVNISGNTCDASVAVGSACNVELNQDSYEVINTYNGGLYPGAYIGVYVDGTEGADSNYDKHGVERKPFGTFTENDNTTNFYSFVNDRNGLKGGIIEETDPNYQHGKNCIYWIQIFSLNVTKEVVSGASTAVDPDEVFLFKVNVRGNATVTGQLNAAQIDSSNGDYGEMEFTSNRLDTTTAVFSLADGQTISGVNLSEGLSYEVIEYLTVEQAKRYAAMPMNGAGSTIESLDYNGVTYQVIRVNTFASIIGENKERTDVDPYTSALTFSNLMPVCKITDMSGNILYRRYDWEKVTNKAGEGKDGGSSTNQPHYYAPAVYTELTGDDGAFKALEGSLYRSNGSNPISYSVANGVQIQMLIGEYKLNETVAASTGKVTLTTASAEDTLFPKQDAGTTSTIRRSFAGGSMFEVTGDLTFATIILDGAKGSYRASKNGGIANVPSDGRLTIQTGATLQNSRTDLNYHGGAVYVGAGGTVTMTGGIVNRNESGGDGAGIYLEQGSTLNLSDSPGFGGTGRDVSGNITTTNGNFKSGELIAQTNGGKNYTRARQDIYIAEAQDDPASLVLTGDLNVDGGSIWIWAETENHYAMMKPFARIGNDAVDGTTYAAFRNARQDSETNCGQDNYLTGSSGDNAMFIYWAGGFDVSFRKIDGFGTAMSSAAFTLYTDPACTEALKQGGGDATAVSADGTAAYTDKAGTALEEGTVLFEQIPAGVYYMKETVTPDGCVNALTKDAAGDPVSNVYIVLVGDTALQGAGSGALEDITQEQVTAQTGTGDDQKDAAVFLIDPSTGRAAATPDIARYGIMNISTVERRAILRKVSNAFTSLEGAEFEVLRYDRTPVSGTDRSGAATTSFTSTENGVYFVDMLPLGTYYLHETRIPSGYQEVTSGGDGNWFILTVSESGVGYERETGTGTTLENTLRPEAAEPD